MAVKISFDKQAGDPALNIAFCWLLRLEGQGRGVSDHFIPELFFDYFFIRQGGVSVRFLGKADATALPSHCLKAIHTQPLIFAYELPLELYGARLSPLFAESYWGDGLPANTFLPEVWAPNETASLATFSAAVATTLRARRESRFPEPMLTGYLEEQPWLSRYSPRHRRRLIRQHYGVSRKEIGAIQNLHAFLGQTCDFSLDAPRIIEHVDYETFYDQPHLNRAFKKMTGRSPLTYFEDSAILQDNLMAASYNGPGR